MSFKRDADGIFIATKTFLMPKTAKRMMATITNDVARHAFKNAMAQAVMQSFEVIESKKKKNAAGKPEVEPA